MYILERMLKSSHGQFWRRMEGRAWCMEVNTRSLSQEIRKKSSESNFFGPGRAAIFALSDS